MSSTSKDGLLALCGSFMGLSTIAVSLRFYNRQRQRVGFQADDWLALLAVVGFVGTAIVTIVFVSEKILGYSSHDFTKAEAAAQLKPSAKLGYSFDFINTTSLAAIKLSALFFYRRIFVTVYTKGDWFKRVIYGLMAIIVCWYITYMFLALFQCRTHFDAAEHGEATKYCALNWPWALGLAISDFLLDLIVVLIPIPRVWSLRTTVAKRLSIIGIFGLAFVGLGASIARLVFYVEYRGAVFWLHHDFERLYTRIIYIQVLESGISATAINLPCLWGLFTSFSMHRVVRSIRSLMSLRSRSRSNEQSSFQSNEAAPGAMEQKVEAAKRAHATHVSDWGSVDEQHSDSSQLAFRKDLEGQSFAAYATRHPDSDGSESGDMHDNGGILVKKGLEVTHEESV